MPNQISKYNRFFTDHKRNRKLPRTTVHRHKMKKIKHKLLKNDVLLLNNSFDQRSEEVLVEFVFDADSLYGRDIYTSGMHELVHLVECTEVMGNMNGLCCFAFEELNRKVTRSIKGSDLIGDEFLKIWGVSLNLSLRVHDFKEENQFVNLC